MTVGSALANADPTRALPDPTILKDRCFRKKRDDEWRVVRNKPVPLGSDSAGLDVAASQEVRHLWLNTDAFNVVAGVDQRWSQTIDCGAPPRWTEQDVIGFEIEQSVFASTDARRGDAAANGGPFRARIEDEEAGARLVGEQVHGLPSAAFAQPNTARILSSSASGEIARTTSKLEAFQRSAGS